MSALTLIQATVEPLPRGDQHFEFNVLVAKPDIDDQEAEQELALSNKRELVAILKASGLRWSKIDGHDDISGPSSPDEGGPLMYWFGASAVACSRLHVLRLAERVAIWSTHKHVPFEKQDFVRAYDEATHLITGTVEPQAQRSSQLWGRIGHQLGWRTDTDPESSDGCEADLVLSKRTTADTLLRVGIDDEGGSSDASLFVEIYVASVDDYFLMASLDVENYTGLSSWLTSPSHARALLTKLETALKADNPRVVRVKTGHDPYVLKPLKHFDTVISELRSRLCLHG